MKFHSSKVCCSQDPLERGDGNRCEGIGEWIGRRMIEWGRGG